MKVLLVQPPVEDFYDTPIRTYPLSIIYLGSKIKDICDVTLVDLRSNRKPNVLHGNPFQELQPFYIENTYSPFSFFTRYYRFGCNAEEIRRLVLKHNPDIVGISSLFTPYAEEALEVAEIVKKVNQDIRTIVGGIHPTLFPEHPLRTPYVDYVIRGEGETPLFQLVSALQSGRTKNINTIQGVCYKNGGSLHISDIHIEREIDLVPDRNLVSPEDYRMNGKNYASFLTSRGCPYQCAFCGKPPVPYRKRSLVSIEKEIAECSSLDIRAIDFEDDMLNLDTSFFNEVLKLFEGKGFTLSAMNGLYSESLDVKTLENMYRAGFRRLNFSLVDVSRAVIRGQKRHFPENILKLLPYLESSPFHIETHFIIGLPRQEPEDILETIIFLMGKRLLLGPSLFYLAPYSPLCNEIITDTMEGYFKMMRSSYMMPVNPRIPRKTLYTCMKLVRFINYVKRALDREVNLTKLDDLLELPQIKRNERDAHILATLLTRERFICYDKKTGCYRDESQDTDFVSLFFRKARNLPIKGFKTEHSLGVL